MTDIILKIKKLISEYWKNIFAEVCDAVVYVDHCAIECLHWYTAGKGYLALKDAGAVAVYEFGMYHFRYVEVKDTKKAVIISTSGDPAFYQRTIKMILAKNTFQNCIVYCGVPCGTINHLGTLSAEEKLDYNKLKKDIKVWMTSGNLSQEVLKSYEIPGCLASMEDEMMDLLISQKGKRLLNTVNQFLNDITLAKGSPKLRTPTRISGHSLEKLLSKIQSTNSIDSMTIHTEKLQCILAIIEASISQKADQIELLTSLEKLALQNLSVSRESSSILVQLSNIIRTRILRGLDVENLLALLIHVYSLAGTQIRFSTQQERRLEESIADAIFEDFQILKENPLMNTKSAYQRSLLLLGGDDVAVAQETSCNIAARILNTLRLIAEQRLILQDYRFCMLKPSSQEATRYISILEQVTKDIFSVDMNRELRDLHKKSSSFISAGFNLILRGKTKRHPRDNPYILIYVVGGITAEEAKVIQEVVSAHSNEKSPHIILAGSRLLNPLDIVDKMFFS